MPRAWLVRAGKHGENELLALDENAVVIGWGDLPDLDDVKTKDELVEVYRATYPDAGEKRLLNHVGQVWAFRDTISVGDLAVLPLKSRPVVAIGRFVGPYTYRPEFPRNARHTRPVEWLMSDVPRTAIGQDLLYTLGAFLTVCEVRRNEGAARISALAAGHPDPGMAIPTSASRPIEAPDDTIADGNIDVERYAADTINAFIAQHFAGHGLARLVEAVFRARGMVTWLAPAGPDGGIDVLVGSGPLGMDNPRICVQVKSQQSPVDVRVVRELQGVVGRVGASQGLLVAWGGVNKPTERELRNEFFQVRVWDADDLVRELTSVYDSLPEEIQTELPLKRVWALAVEDGS